MRFLILTALLINSTFLYAGSVREIGFDIGVLKSQSTPANPPSGSVKLYNKSGTITALSSSGTETALGGSAGSLPVGSIITMASSTCPPNTIAADGASLLRTSYSTLFSAVGTAHGASDGTHFNLPDYRGRFLRGVAGTSTNDPDKTSRTAMATGGNTGNAVGSVQGDGFGSHTHTITPVTSYGGSGSSTGFSYMTTPDLASYSNQTTLSAGGNETRPKNAYVNYCIVYQ